MFNLQSVDPFEALLSKARGIVSERAKILDGIRENEVRLRTEKERLTAAQKLVRQQEFDAAQAPGSLAIASEAAQQESVDAGLRVKSVNLRLEGMQSKLSQVEGNLSAVRGEMEEFTSTFLAERVAELGTQFDEAISQVIRLFCKANALYRGNERRIEKKPGCSPPAFMHAARLENPISRFGAAILDQDFFRTSDGKKQTFANHWMEDPDAEQLHRKIAGMKDRIAEIDGAAQSAGITQVAGAGEGQ